MNKETLQRKVIVTNPNGFHMRPAAEFAKLAAQFESSVIIGRDDLRIDGKSLMELFLLVALPGTELTLEVTGPDAQAALESLSGLLAAPSVDDSDSPVPQKG